VEDPIAIVLLFNTSTLRARWVVLVTAIVSKQEPVLWILRSISISSGFIMMHEIKKLK
jgi:hypothetical protein